MLLSGAISKSCCVLSIFSECFFNTLLCYTAVALSLDISSSSFTAVPETAVLNTPFVTVGAVKVLFVNVSVASIKETVPVALGNVIVLSA